MEVAVLGAGSWGTALAILLARNGHDVTLVGRDPDEIASLESCRENLHYLPGFVVPENVRFALIGATRPLPEMTVMAVPSGAVRSLTAEISGEAPLVVIAAKGLEAASNSLLSEVLQEELPQADLGVLSGPNLAVEIVQGIPTAAVSACVDLELADRIRQVFMCRTFRVYLSSDVVGVELSGALKNVLAIGAGMSDGLGFGDNTKGALLARGLNEMSRLGLAMGARTETFMGLAGVGDLFATASSRLSRNYRVGKALGQGGDLSDILKNLGQVAEGVATSESALVLGRKHGIDLPVFEAVASVLRARVRPMQAVSLLMERVPRCDSL